LSSVSDIFCAIIAWFHGIITIAKVKLIDNQTFNTDKYE